MTHDEILESLIAAKMPNGVILAVAKLIAEAETAGRIRAVNAERQRRHRASRYVTQRHDTSHDPPRAYTTPPKIESKKILSMPIPENFVADLEYATARGWSLAYAQSEASRFRDHALAKGRKCRDWQAAWRNWVTSPFQNSASRPNGEHHDPLERRNGESLGDLARRLADEARRREAVAGIEAPTLPLASG